MEAENWWHTNTKRREKYDLWQRLDQLCVTHQVQFRWVKGHAGHKENERCDELAMAALRQPNLPVDEGYENRSESDGIRPEMQEREPCLKCSAPVIKQTGRKKPKRDNYYKFFLYCPGCKATYQVESAKRLVEQAPALL